MAIYFFRQAADASAKANATAELRKGVVPFIQNLTEVEAMSEFLQTEAVIQSGFERGWHYGLQIYVSLNGRAILDRGYGRSADDVPMTIDTIMPWLSAGKPMTAVAVLILVDRGLLSLDEPVCRVIPEFAQGGKQDITLRHLLTHTGGIRNVPSLWPQAQWNETIELICKTPIEPDWVVGKTAGYHIASSWYVLGELILRLDGRLPQQFLRQEIFEPLGMLDSWNGMPLAHWERYGDRIGRMWNRERGTVQELEWHDALHCETCSPGGNTRGPIRELGRFYEALFSPSFPLLSETLRRAMTTPQRVGQFDLTLQHVVDFGLGMIINSKQYGPQTVPYGYGTRSSSRACGHGGSQSSIGFVDPDHGLVVAYVANIRPGEAGHQRRHRELIEAIWNDAIGPM